MYKFYKFPTDDGGVSLLTLIIKLVIIKFITKLFKNV